MREANLDLLVEASGFTKKKMAEFDELTEEQVRVKEELGESDSDDGETDVCLRFRVVVTWGWFLTRFRTSQVFAYIHFGILHSVAHCLGA